jgi:hypothetical protein
MTVRSVSAVAVALALAAWRAPNQAQSIGAQSIGAQSVHAQSAGAPTFYRDALPILQQHCQRCHRAGEIAPMPLTSYAETKPFAAAIAADAQNRKMPPWFADPDVGRFANNPSL